MLERFYRSLYRIRKVEEKIAEIYPTDKIQSPVHLSIGQEAISVAVCEALRPGDIVFGSYRCHALYLAKGGDLRRMIAELYGKATGCAKGKGGSMHLIDVAAGVMGASAVVGTTIPQAVGYALAIKMSGSDSRCPKKCRGRQFLRRRGIVEGGLSREPEFRRPRRCRSSSSARITAWPSMPGKRTARRCPSRTWCGLTAFPT